MLTVSEPLPGKPKAHDKVRAYLRLASPALSDDELLDVADLVHDIIRRRRGLNRSDKITAEASAGAPATVHAAPDVRT